MGLAKRDAIDHNISVSIAYKQGEHICSLYDGEDEQVTVAAQYLADGLRRGERCLYADDGRDGFQRFRDALNREDIDAAAAARAGALIELPHSKAHLAGGRFDGERMLAMLDEAVEHALNDGFMGLRTCGDMSWMLTGSYGYEQVQEYESLLNEFFRQLRACGMCQYDRRRFRLNVIEDALTTHSTMVLDGHHQPSPLYKERRPRI